MSWPAARDALVAIVESSRFMLCQTEDLRSFLEHVIPEAVGKTFVVPPVFAESMYDRNVKGRGLGGKITVTK